MSEKDIAKNVRAILKAVGENPQRTGLERTPERVAAMLEDILSGYKIAESEVVDGAVIAESGKHDVLVRDIQFYCLCEHHLLPFMGKVSVAYLSTDRIIGLGRIPKIVHFYARRLQTQERLTSEIAALLERILLPDGLAVKIEATHLCAAMRGDREQGMSLVTWQFSGSYDQPEMKTLFESRTS